MWQINILLLQIQRSSNPSPSISISFPEAVILLVIDGDRDLWPCLWLWPLARSNTGSPRFTDFPSLCACPESSWFWSQSIVFTEPFKTGMSLDLARGQGSDFQRMTKGTPGDEVASIQEVLMPPIVTELWSEHWQPRNQTSGTNEVARRLYRRKSYLCGSYH